MEQTLSIPDALASDVNRFAGEQDVPIDRAYELLVSVGLSTLDGRNVDVYVEDERLLFECPGCETVFDEPSEAADHDCADH
jgi:hypothetical protein